MKLNKLYQFHTVVGEAFGWFSLGNIFFNPTTVVNKYLTFNS